ncbi:CaiB/BaiF CoA transferase family protein [Williamsia soli]|uniref:CaiB/BaiF CoA transferase family protein n=1 Tax=Williamsia soli TaxID=364929 RepID=UPI001A9EE61A
MTTSSDPRPPLDGLVVADFSRVLAGPMATMTLADLGATVIKVERPGSGDDTRSWGPPWTPAGSSYFESVNRSKRSVCLDFSNEDDLEAARELARRADVLIHNFLPGPLERSGLDYQSVSNVNPGIVYCAISGFGSAAGAALPGYDFVVQAMGGLMSITGEAEGDPMKVGVALVDVLTGKDATVAVLAALAARHRDGVGQHIEVSLMSSLLGALANQSSSYLATGQAPGRMGNHHPSVAPYEPVQCHDALLVVACGNDRQFASLAEVVGEPGLASDERFATNRSRVENRVALTKILEGHLIRDTAVVWESRMRNAGVPAGRVADIGEALQTATDLGLAPVAEMPAGYTDQVAHPVRYSRSPLRPFGPPPGLGEHTDSVRHWLSGDAAAPPP